MTRNEIPIGRPTEQDVTWQGKTIKNGVQLWPVGTDTAKATIYSRLGLKEKGPGYVHFPIGIDDNFYLQLTAEKRVTRYVKGFPVAEWVKIRERNEGLDCYVYAYAAAIRAGLITLNWEQLEKTQKTQSQPPKREQRDPTPEEPERPSINFERPSWLDR